MDKRQPIRDACHEDAFGTFTHILYTLKIHFQQDVYKRQGDEFLLAVTRQRAFGDAKQLAQVVVV